MPIPHERFTQLNSEERYQDYLEEQAERRQSLRDTIEFDQRHGGIEWINELDIPEGEEHEVIARLWLALNGQKKGTADSADEAIDNARDSVMSYIRHHAEREVKDND